MKAKDNPKARFCCMECDELLPQGAETCPHCGAVVAEMNFNFRSNWRGAKLATKEEIWDKAAEDRKKQKEWNDLKKRLREDSLRPVSAVIVSTTSKDDTMGRVLAGTFLFGPVGGIIAGHGGRNTVKEVTFSVKYKNGTTKLETVHVNSKRYEELAKLLVR